MAVQSRYEGPDLEILLDQVRSELGAGITIVSANKLRSGGLGGFFARERFEVIVEHDGLAIPPADVAADPTRSVRPRDIAPSLMDLVDQVSAEERAVAPRVSTESEPFASILQRVARDAGVDEDTPATPRASIHVDADEADDFDSRDSRDRQIDDVDDEALFTPSAPIAQPAAHPLHSAPAAQPLRVAQPAPAPAPVRSMPAPSSTLPVPAPVNLPAVGGHVGALVKMGLPASYVPAAPSPAAVEAALRASLSRLPEAPPMPRGTGSVVAVVGERQAALSLARDLASEAGLDPDAIAIATRKRLPARTPENLIINGSEEAAEKRRSWRRRERASIVVIDTELSAEKPAWAYHVLAALEPSATWGVVDATRKTEDVAAWVTDLGGVDALAVNDLDATSSPAAVLQLDVPVGRIDGRPASPALWAALLTERLAA